MSLRHTSCFYIIVLLVRVCASRWRRLKIDALIGLVERLYEKSILFVVFLSGMVFTAGIAQASTHEFFKGKTIRLVVGYSAGGAMDDWARLVARHLGKHISGNPDIVVQNMPGAGGITAANYIFNIAKPDGLSLGVVNPALLTSL